MDHWGLLAFLLLVFVLVQVGIGQYKYKNGLIDKNHVDLTHEKIAKRAAYITGKELGKTFHVGTRKRKLRR